MKAKLVRDKIPEIIHKSGKITVTHVALGDEAKKAVIAKMYEEIQEFEEEPSLEEAADIYQVFMTLLTVHNLTFDNVIKKAVYKSADRGRFDQMIILDEVLNK